MGCISRREMRCAELSVMAEFSVIVGAVSLVRAESLHGSEGDRSMLYTLC